MRSVGAEEEVNLVERRCLKADCNNTFKALPTSENRYCSRDHDPNPTGRLNAIRSRDKAMAKVSRERMLVIAKEALAEGRTREQMLDRIHKENLKGPNGNRINMTYLNNFMSHHGLTKKRGPRPKTMQWEIGRAHV